jgi:predicted RNase H-like HicB family nuclease
MSAWPILIKYDDECGVFVAHCQPLRLYSQAETWDRAQLAGESAVKGWMELCRQRRVLIKALIQRRVISIN